MASEILKLVPYLAIHGFKDNLPHVSATGGTLRTALNIVISIVAALSVLFVVIGGLRFVLSAGNPQEAAKARSTVVFAAVGLLICITAEAVVAFALSKL